MGRRAARAAGGGVRIAAIVYSAAGAGRAMTFDVDGGDSNTYSAINVGAKISYELTPRLSFVLSPQGDIAFTDPAHPRVGHCGWRLLAGGPGEPQD